MSSLVDLVRIPITEKLNKYVEAYQWLKRMEHEEFIDTQVLIEKNLNKFKQEVLSEETKISLVLCVKYLYLENYKYSLYGTRYEDDGREKKEHFEYFFLSFFSEWIEKHQQHKGILVEGIGKPSLNERYFFNEQSKNNFYQALKNETNFELILSQYILRKGRYDDGKSILFSNLVSIAYELDRHTHLSSSFQFPSIGDDYIRWKNQAIQNDKMISTFERQIDAENGKFFKSKKTIEYLLEQKKLNIQQREAFFFEISTKFNQYQQSFFIFNKIRDSFDEIRTMELILECRNAIKEGVQLKHLLLEKGFELAELNRIIK